MEIHNLVFIWVPNFRSKSGEWGRNHELLTAIFVAPKLLFFPVWKSTSPPSSGLLILELTYLSPSMDAVSNRNGFGNLLENLHSLRHRAVGFFCASIKHHVFNYQFSHMRKRDGRNLSWTYYLNIGGLLNLKLGFMIKENSDMSVHETPFLETQLRIQMKLIYKRLIFIQFL